VFKVKLPSDKGETQFTEHTTRYFKLFMLCRSQKTDNETQCFPIIWKINEIWFENSKLPFNNLRVKLFCIFKHWKL